MRHALIEKSSDRQIAIAEEAADWLIDALAAGSQDRKYLRGDPECDKVLCDFIMANGKLAALRALHKIESGE